MDQLMNFAWKFMLPMALINIIVAGAWHFMPPGIIRWITLALVLAASWALLGRGISQKVRYAARTYRYAPRHNSQRNNSKLSNSAFETAPIGYKVSDPKHTPHPL